MDKQELMDRTRRFGVAIIQMCGKLPQSYVGDAIGKQIIRSATSVGANYRSACRGRSRADFISRIAISEEEADETLYWLEIIRDAHMLSNDILDPLLREANELTAIFTSIRRTSRQTSKS